MAAAGSLVEILIAVLFLTVVSLTLGNLPVIGPPIKAWCNAHQPNWSGLRQTLLFPIQILSLFFTHVIRKIVTFAWYLPSGVLGWVNDAEAAVRAEIQAVKNSALRWVNDAEAAVSAEIVSLQSRVLHWVNDAEAAVSAEVLSLQSRVLNWVNDAEATVRGDITRTVDGLRSWATGQIALVQAALLSFQERALQWVNQGEAEVRRDLAADVGSLQDMIKELQKALASSDAQTAAEVAAAAAAIAGVTEALSDLEKNCVNNLCFNLSDMADVINDMDMDAGLAAMMALIALSAHDPKEAANTVEDLFGGAAKSVNDIVSKM